MALVGQSQVTAPHLLSSDKNNNVVGVLSKSRDVTSTFYYHKHAEDASPPAPVYINDPSTYPRENVPVQKVVHDIRGEEDRYTLDTTGFQVYRHESVERDFVDDEQIKKVYYPEIEEILKKATGAPKVFIFDHTVRRTEKPVEPAQPSDPDAPINQRGPFKSVHVDQSYTSSLGRVKYHLPDEAETLLKGRVQIINVWRPIKTIRKDPLGVVTADSVKDDELVTIHLIYPDRAGETFAVRPEKKDRTDGGHKWNYLSEQTPKEVLLLKCFDSKTDGRARRVPHSAFVDEETEGEDGRESIEVRALVFHPDDTE